MAPVVYALEPVQRKVVGIECSATSSDSRIRTISITPLIKSRMTLVCTTCWERHRLSSIDAVLKSAITKCRYIGVEDAKSQE